MNAIRNAKNNQASDFVFLRQDCRDVARDKNYLIKLAVQIDPDFRANGPKTVFTNFLEERIHYLLNDKDTVASFTIRKNLLNTEGKKIYLNQVSNGSDVNSIFRMDNTSEWMIRYNYTLSGIINGKYFSILCAGTDNSVKEFYLEGKMVCVSEGGNSLKKFVVIDASLNAELLNQLFIIGFNAFIE